MNRLLVVCVLCLLVVVQAMAMPMDKESSRVKRQWGSPFGGGFGRGPYGGGFGGPRGFGPPPSSRTVIIKKTVINRPSPFGFGR